MGGIAYVYDWQERSYDPPECHPGQQAYTFLIRILSTSFISVSIFSVCCYSRVSFGKQSGFPTLTVYIVYTYLLSSGRKLGEVRWAGQQRNWKSPLVQKTQGLPAGSTVYHRRNQESSQVDEFSAAAAALCTGFPTKLKRILDGYAKLFCVLKVTFLESVYR
jgi:hypothetical protein